MKNPIGNPLTLFYIDKPILKQVKRNKSIIYGGKAIKKHIGFIARPTKDYDIISKRPRKSARQLEKTLDKKAGGDYYYTEPAVHEGTHRVRHIGLDRRRGTNDDIHIADISKPVRKYRTKTMDGIKYVALKEIVRDKKRILGLKEFQFRHEKDKDDLSRIKLARKLKIRWRRK